MWRGRPRPRLPEIAEVALELYGFEGHDVSREAATEFSPQPALSRPKGP